MGDDHTLTSPYLIDAPHSTSLTNLTPPLGPTLLYPTHHPPPPHLTNYSTLTSYPPPTLPLPTYLPLLSSTLSGGRGGLRARPSLRPLARQQTRGGAGPGGSRAGARARGDGGVGRARTHPHGPRRSVPRGTVFGAHWHIRWSINSINSHTH